MFLGIMKYNLSCVLLKGEFMNKHEFAIRLEEDIRNLFFKNEKDPELILLNSDLIENYLYESVIV